LGEGDARALLDAVVTGPLDPGVRDQLVSEGATPASADDTGPW